MSEFIYKPDHYPGPVAIDCTPSKECDEYHKKAMIQIFHTEWGGTARCITSDGRNVNIAEELNRLENEKINEI